jgi:hypothetical protein
MHYLWNTGALSQRLADAVAEETGIPLFLADHPIPQQYAVGCSYDEGAAILGGYIALCSNRPLTENERNIVSAYWIGQKQLRQHS